VSNSGFGNRPPCLNPATTIVTTGNITAASDVPSATAPDHFLGYAPVETINSTDSSLG
jgi:hypothetical protein